MEKVYDACELYEATAGATISMFHAVRYWNRKNIPGYVEIFIEVPLEVLHLRVSKGICARAANSENANIAGLDLVVEFPAKPDVYLRYDSGRDAKATFKILTLELTTLLRK